jgi:sec-independent protein translocase protein TatC
MSNDPPDSEEHAEDGTQAQGEMTFVEHLVELRDRLLRIVLSVLCFLVVLFPFANDLYALLAEPLLRHLPEGTSMIATQVASPSFVAPGLYKHERRLIFPLLVTSSVLFYLGMAFAYFVVFPLMFAFFQAVAPEGVAIMTDISAYLDFVLKIFFAFGVAFEVPIATILLVWTGFTTPAALVSKRPYIIVGAFVLGMMLTPPDIISQTLLALPMWMLFELGVLFSKFYAGKRLADAGEDEAAEA